MSILNKLKRAAAKLKKQRLKTWKRRQGILLSPPKAHSRRGYGRGCDGTLRGSYGRGNFQLGRGGGL